MNARQEREQRLMRLQIRRNVLEDAKALSRNRDGDRCLEKVIYLLECIQRDDEEMYDMRENMHLLIEQTRKVLELDQMSRPIIIKVEPE